MASEKSIVVLGVDGSHYSDYAFEWYINNFHKPENTLLLVHCPEIHHHIHLTSAHKHEEHVKECEEKTKALEEKYLAKIKEVGATGEFHVAVGEKPGFAITEFSEKHEASYIVTGTRGHGTIRRTIMGSVSDYILHHSLVPVLICRHKDHHHHHGHHHHHHHHGHHHGHHDPPE